MGHEVEKSYKIAVYAISLNEESFVERFCESAKLADYIVIADTGSTDKTVELAKQHTPYVYSISIQPWRFDHARNASLALVPADADICICLDLDEVLEPDWRDKLLAAWQPSTTRLRYLFDWSRELRFFSDKIHKRFGYQWKHPCHELLVPQTGVVESWGQSAELLISHYPDSSKSRSSYLALLSIGAQEDPKCPRNSFYYARELVYNGQTELAVTELERYLKLETATWEVERSYAMRVLGDCLFKLGQPARGLQWLRRACAEDPQHREPWYYLTRKYHDLGQWADCYASAKQVLSIVEKDHVYTAEAVCWSSQPYDYAALAAFNLGLLPDAIYYGKKALELSPGNSRLIANLKAYNEILGSSAPNS